MRRLRALAAVAALALTLVAVGGCSTPETAPPEVTVTGEPGAAPTITYLTPLDVDSTATEQIWPGHGSGAGRRAGGPHRLLARGRDGRVPGQGELLEQADRPAAHRGGPRQGPVPDAAGPEASGRGCSRSARQRQRRHGLPDRHRDRRAPDPCVRRGGPAACRPARPSRSTRRARRRSPRPAPSRRPTLVAQPLVRGTGDQVQADDVVTVQYTGFAWTSGEVVRLDVVARRAARVVLAAGRAGLGGRAGRPARRQPGDARRPADATRSVSRTARSWPARRSSSSSTSSTPAAAGRGRAG